jgi:hypothetical protein
MIFPGDGAKQKHHYKKFPVKAWFEYRCWEDEQSSHAELWHHTHQQCLVLHMLSTVESDCEMYQVESDYEMYRVRFADGFEEDVFADELMQSKLNFRRSDYKQKSIQCR